MIGLLLWHAESGDDEALACCRRMGDLFCRRFLDGTESLHDSLSHEMNQAPAHSLMLLYNVTGEPRYLRMAERIKDEFAIPPAGDYLNAPLNGLPFWETPKPRWESLHPIMGLVELYYATGDTDYRTAFERLWWSMLEGDRHNNGGFTSGEKATGNPFDRGAIETCCTVAWMAMSVEMLRLTGNPIIADELELSMLNSGLGMMNAHGRWVTYNTPMDGRREASAHTIVFQAAPGSPELNCCSVNGPRAVGMLCEWAVMHHANGIALNYYGPCSVAVPVPNAGGSGARLTLSQETDYPRDSTVRVNVGLDAPAEFSLFLRIPHWSKQTEVHVNDDSQPAVTGTYLEIARTWQPGDVVELAFDFRPRFWRGERGSRDFVTKWRLFGPVSPETVCEDCPEQDVTPRLEGMTTVPHEVMYGGKNLRATEHTSASGTIDAREFSPDTKSGDVLLGFTEIEVPEACEVVFECSIDWLSRWFVNGVQVSDTYEARSHAAPVGRNHHIRCRLKAGKNLITFCNSGGSRYGCWLSVGVDGLPVEDADIFGRFSIYRGPILLAFDHRFNEFDDAELPELDLETVNLKPADTQTWLRPWMLMETPAADGTPVRLCDFASAGAGGNSYRSWLPATGPFPDPVEFDRSDPSRTTRY